MSGKIITWHNPCLRNVFNYSQSIPLPDFSTFVLYQIRDFDMAPWLDNTPIQQKEIDCRGWYVARAVWQLFLSRSFVEDNP